MPFAKEMSCSFLQAQSIVLSISPMTLSPGQFSGDLRGANRGQHLAGVSKILLSQLIVSCDSEGVAEKQGSRRTTFCCSPPSIKNPLAEHGDSA